MKVSLSWLSAYVPIQMSISRLSNALTMTGLEVEAISDRYEYLNSVFVSRIIEINPHPNADNLNLCTVDIGKRSISVVCAAPNLRTDMFVPAALPGTHVPNRTPLEKSIIRGIVSEGMLCSEAELGLGLDRSGVMELSDTLPVGARLNQALSLTDTVFEIGLTPNRPDCLSIIGIAREVAAIQNTNLIYPKIRRLDATNENFDIPTVSIKAPGYCPRYVAGLVENIRVSPSPFWLQDRLMSVDLRPINNIVDITNFVMMETGQPLHAFDFKRLAKNRIIVRTAEENERFSTLDGKERLLSADMLLICDGEKPVAIAGVMGGLNSEIEASTSSILIESAYFSPVSIRKTSKKLGLATDASHRFERGVDPDGTVSALNRAAQLMVEIGGGQLAGEIIDEHPAPVPLKTVYLNVKDTNRLLGTRLTQKKIVSLLQSIEFIVKKQKTPLLAVTPPTFRVDIERPEDLMEEIARLAGYHTIPTTFPLIPAEAKNYSKTLALRDRIKKLLIGFGFTEIINYSFISRRSCDDLGLPAEDHRRALLNILNPLTDDQAVMRTSLMPGLLRTLHHNLAQQNRNLKQFEIGKIFLGRGEDVLPQEVEMLAGLLSGSRVDADWHTKEIDADFYDIKGVVEGLFSRLQVDDIKFVRASADAQSYLRTGYAAQILIGDQTIGIVGEVSPQVLFNFDLKQSAFVFELNLDALSANIPDTKHIRPIPKFPAISRDTTIIVDKDIEAESISANIKNAGEKLVEDVYIFDIFSDEPIPPGKKSVSLRIVYRSDKKTLEDDTVNNIHKRLTGRLLTEFRATFPT